MDREPTLAEQVVAELKMDPARTAKLTEIEKAVSAAVDSAADELYEVLMGNQSDSGRKLAAAIMLRGYIERVVDRTLSAKAAERGPILL